MPRPITSGRLSFGRLSIPIDLHVALDERERPAIRQLHRKDLEPIEYRCFCRRENVEVPRDDIIRGYEIRKGRFTPLESELPAGAQEHELHVELLHCVELASLDPLLLDKPYLLAPRRAGERGYGALRAALIDARRVGIARFALRGGPALGAIVPRRQVLALQVMRAPAHLCDAGALHVRSSTPRPSELKLARALVDQMTEEWDPGAPAHVYRRVLERVLKSKGAASAASAPIAESGRDLVAALQASLAAGPSGADDTARGRGAA